MITACLSCLTTGEPGKKDTVLPQKLTGEFWGQKLEGRDVGPANLPETLMLKSMLAEKRAHHQRILSQNDRPETN